MEANYFKRENGFLTFFILSGLLVIIPVMIFYPQALLFMETPFLQHLYKFAIDNPQRIWIFYKYVLYIHLGEAFFTFILAGFYHKLTVQATLKWTLSVSVHGVFSLRRLIWI